MAEELALGLEGFVFVIEGPGEDRAVDSYHDVVSDNVMQFRLKEIAALLGYGNLLGV